MVIAHLEEKFKVRLLKTLENIANELFKLNNNVIRATNELESIRNVVRRPTHPRP